jgi:hypothetical protein
LWEKVVTPSSTIRISPVPQANKFLVKISGDGLVPAEMQVTPNTHVKVTMRSTASIRREQEQQAAVNQQQQQQQRVAEQQRRDSEAQRRFTRNGAAAMSGTNAFPESMSSASSSSSTAPIGGPRRMSRKYSQESSTRIDTLTVLSAKIDLIQSKIDGFEKAVRDGTASGAQLSKVQDALAQCYGNLEKVQFTEIDAIVTADLTTGKDAAKELRKTLSKRTSHLLNIVEGLVNEIKKRRNKA